MLAFDRDPSAADVAASSVRVVSACDATCTGNFFCLQCCAPVAPRRVERGGWSFVHGHGGVCSALGDDRPDDRRDCRRRVAAALLVEASAEPHRLLFEYDCPEHGTTQWGLDGLYAAADWEVSTSGCRVDVGIGVALNVAPMGGVRLTDEDDAEIAEGALPDDDTADRGCMMMRFVVSAEAVFSAVAAGSSSAVHSAVVIIIPARLEGADRDRCRRWMTCGGAAAGTALPVQCLAAFDGCGVVAVSTLRARRRLHQRLRLACVACGRGVALTLAGTAVQHVDDEEGRRCAASHFRSAARRDAQQVWEASQEPCFAFQRGGSQACGDEAQAQAWRRSYLHGLVEDAEGTPGTYDLAHDVHAIYRRRSLAPHIEPSAGLLSAWHLFGGKVAAFLQRTQGRPTGDKDKSDLPLSDLRELPVMMFCVDIVVEDTVRFKKKQCGKRQWRERSGEDQEARSSSRAEAHIFGRTRCGFLLHVLVQGFRPYLYVSLLASTPASVVQMLSVCAASIKDVRADHEDAALDDHLVSVSPVMRRRLHGAALDSEGAQRNQPFLKLTFCSLRHRRRCAQALREHLATHPEEGVAICEDNVGPLQQFLACCGGLASVGWVGIAAGDVKAASMSSECAAQITCTPHDLCGLPGVSHPAPLVVCSFDIETTTLDPGAHGARVTAVGVSVRQLCAPLKSLNLNLSCASSAAPLSLDVVHLLGSVVGASSRAGDPRVIGYGDELALLHGFLAQLVNEGADVIIGYNVRGFDWPYLQGRMQRLTGVSAPLSLSRLTEQRRPARELSNYMQARLADAVDRKQLVHAPGRAQTCIHLAMRARFKRDDEKLNTTALRFLGEQKLDLDYATMAQYYASGEPEKLMEIARYCIVDCQLPYALMLKLCILSDILELAALTWTSAADVQEGKQRFMFNRIYRAVHEAGYVLDRAPPVVARTGKYEGAAVFEPVPSMLPAAYIATLDFASLYPSEMLASNVCYSTAFQTTTPREAAALADARARGFAARHELPGGDEVFVAVTYGGVLSSVIRELQAERAAARSAQKHATADHEVARFNSKQLSIKQIVNSLYGLMGASDGKLPMLRLARLVTSLGRSRLYHTRELLEGQCSRDAGRTLEVVYGDTDSCFVKLQARDLREAFGIVAGAVRTINACMRGALLEHENMYLPTTFVQHKKKNYVGMSVEHYDDRPELKAKGMVTSTCPFVQGLQTDIMATITAYDPVADPVATKRNKLQAVQTAIAAALRRVVNLEVSVREATFVCRLHKETERTKKAPHMVAIGRMRQCPLGADRLPQEGDAVPFIIIRAHKAGDTNFAENAFPPDMAARQGLVAKDLNRLYLINQAESAIKKVVPTGVAAMFSDARNACMNDTSGARPITSFFKKPHSGEESIIKKRPPTGETATLSDTGRPRSKADIGARHITAFFATAQVPRKRPPTPAAESLIGNKKQQTGIDSFLTRRKE